MLLAMDTPKEGTSLDLYRTNGVFTIAMVRADPDTQGLESSFAATHTIMVAKHREQEDLEDLLAERKALILIRDRTVDKLIRSFELRLLDMVGKNRADARYPRYFEHGLRAVTEANARTVEPQLVRDIIKTLDEDQNKPEFAPLHAEFRAKLLVAVEAVEAADKACTQVEEQLAFLEDKVIVELKLKWIEERKKLHADLTKKFPHDSARVESYFQRFARPRAKKPV